MSTIFNLAFILRECLRAFALLAISAIILFAIVGSIAIVVASIVGWL